MLLAAVSDTCLGLDYVATGFYGTIVFVWRHSALGNAVTEHWLRTDHYCHCTWL